MARLTKKSLKPQKPLSLTGKLFNVVIVLIGILILYAFYNPENGLLKFWKLSRIYKRESQELDRLLEEKIRLENEIHRLKTDMLYLEKLAREKGMLKEQTTPYPGSNLFSLASGGAIYVRDPHHRLVNEQLNGGEFVPFTQDDWELILPYLRENERLFSIAIQKDLPL